MPEDSPKKKPLAIGYFAVVEDDATGWTGGMLVLQPNGRPLEFQCTLPVRPSKAHQILFGPTLRDHVIGEVIGKLLAARCQSKIGLLCCDDAKALAIEPHVRCPIALACEREEESAHNSEQLQVIGNDCPSGMQPVTLAGKTFWVPMEQVPKVESLLPQFESLSDPSEPFDRIRQAINEAHSQLSRPKAQAA